MAKSKKRKAYYQKLRQKKKQEKALKRKHKKAAKHKNDISDFLSLLSGMPISRKELVSANHYPIYECQISDNWKESGLAYIWLSRRTPLHILAGSFLVDVKCLGLKDTYITGLITEREYREYKNITIQAFKRSFTLKDSPVSLVHAIIYGGIAYAGQFGFKPHKDFKLSKHLLDVETEKKEKVEFGERGKPLYISGPDDDVKEVLRKLINSVGRDGFQFIDGRPIDV